MKTIKQISIIYLLVYSLFNLACQALDPIPITKFSTFIEKSNVSYNTATITSKFMDIGGDLINYGHCWDTIQNPTIDDSKTIFSNTPEKQVEFKSELNKLNSSTEYYVRAYCITVNDTIYSNEISFLSTALTDVDENIYKVVTIGTQVWMAENLNTTKYSNGDDIGTTDPATLDISMMSEPKYQWPYNGEELKAITFGRLYTWYAAKDNRNICPTGWHVPSDDEWTTLELYLQNNGYNCNGFIDTDNDRYTNDFTAKSLAYTSGWTEYSYEVSVGSTAYPAYRNKSGFSAFPGGYRDLSAFIGIDNDGAWWCSTEYSTSDALIRDIVYNAREVERTDLSKKSGLSIRCLKD